MLKAYPRFWTPRNYEIVDGSILVAKTKMNFFGSSGSIEVNGKQYQVQSEFLAKVLTLQDDKGIIARAENQKHHYRYLVKTGNLITGEGVKEYMLETAHLFGRNFTLKSSDIPIGTISSVGIFGSKLNIDFPKELNLLIQSFIIYVVVVSKKSRSAASGA